MFPARGWHGQAGFPTPPCHHPPPLLPVHPSSSQPQQATHSPSGLPWGPRGEERALTSFAPPTHYPRLQHTPGRWWRTTLGLWSQRPGPSSPSPLAALHSLPEGTRRLSPFPRGHKSGRALPCPVVSTAFGGHLLLVTDWKGATGFELMLHLCNQNPVLT